MASDLRSPDHVVLSSTRARQGRWGRPVLWVLLVSTALAALALFSAWTWRAPDLARAPNGPSKAAAASFDSGPPAPQTRQQPGPPGAPDTHPPGSTQ